MRSHAPALTHSSHAATPSPPFWLARDDGKSRARWVWAVGVVMTQRSSLASIFRRNTLILMGKLTLYGNPPRRICGALAPRACVHGNLERTAARDATWCCMFVVGA